MEQSPGFANGHVVINKQEMLKLKTEWQLIIPSADAAEASSLTSSSPSPQLSSVHSSHMELWSFSTETKGDE